MASDMATMKVYLKTIDDVKNLARIAEMMKCDVIEAVSEKSKIDARSIMGLFSLNLTQPIEIRVKSRDADMLKELACFAV